MKTTRIFLGLVMLCGTAFGTPAPTITTTPTNGLTTVTVHARTTDGKLPVGVDCSVYRPAKNVAVYFTQMTPPLFSSVSKSEEWTFTNVPPGYYGVQLLSKNYVEDSHSSQLFSVGAGTNYSIDFVLSRGATFKGRVLDDATGKPIPNADVMGELTNGGGGFNLHTDSEGRYELPHVAGTLVIVVQTTNHVIVMQTIDVGATNEDSTVSVPDIRLQLGGWISGRVESPAGVASTFLVSYMTGIKSELQGSLPTNSAIIDTFIRADGTFRTDPLPPGTYTLHADWKPVFVAGSPMETWQATGSVSGIKVIAGQNTTNVLIPTKGIILTNSTVGR